METSIHLGKLWDQQMFESLIIKLTKRGLVGFDLVTGRSLLICCMKILFLFDDLDKKLFKSIIILFKS